MKLAGLFTLAMATVSVAAKKSYMVVFGDSLSDIGNRGTKGQVIPYFSGRFSDGPLWNEYVAAKNNYTLLNFAYAGSVSNNTLVKDFAKKDVKFPSLAQQVDTFINSLAANVTKKDMRNDLAVIQIGTNDFYYGIDMMDKSAFRSVWYANSVVNNIVTAANKLMVFGFRRILIVNVPDLKVIPEIKKTAGKFTQGLDLFVNLTNLRLEEYAKAVNDRNFRGFHWVRVLNYYDLTGLIMNNEDPKKNFGFINFNVGCNQIVNNNTLSTCSQPDQYFFMDPSYPSARVHAITGAVANEVISDDSFKMNLKSVFDLYTKNELFKVNSTFSPLFNNNSLTTGKIDVEELNQNQFFANKTRFIKEKNKRAANGGNFNLVSPIGLFASLVLSFVALL
ncbi:hypothetical protein BB560_000196 [Smittium megazygosporum]|uniref:SGNH hydrolase-type esterase domain-containing protein n=1 Tax=Smittium megazygosporum TaxID=133381 RepID=A0A2T9ZL26_9FUNG|nr:hypothetical protein BB560_000196 [Smittium megazygosporum]